MRVYFLLSILFFSSCVSFPPHAQVRGAADDTATSSSSTVNRSALKIWIPYVGQGDATLVELPNGEMILIDAGPPNSGPKSLHNLLQNLNSSHLSALLITHYDNDHLGGVPALLAGKDGKLGTVDDIQIERDYDRGGEPWDSSPGRGPYLDALNVLDIPRITLEAGQTIELDPEVEIHCIAVNGTVLLGAHDFFSIDLTPVTYSGQENASSIALLVEYKNFRYLTAGDLTGGGSPNGFLTPDVETLVADAIGAVDVVHVNHHGSLSSSNQHFVETTSPQAVFIQAGKDNPYGHPNSEVVQRWKNIGAEIYSTIDGEGFVLTTDGESFEIEVIGD